MLVFLIRSCAVSRQYHVEFVYEHVIYFIESMCCISMVAYLMRLFSHVRCVYVRAPPGSLAIARFVRVARIARRRASLSL